jgi:hypothetical protein
MDTLKFYKDFLFIRAKEGYTPVNPYMDFNKSFNKSKLKGMIIKLVEYLENKGLNNRNGAEFLQINVSHVIDSDFKYLLSKDAYEKWEKAPKLNTVMDYMRVVRDDILKIHNTIKTEHENGRKEVYKWYFSGKNAQILKDFLKGNVDEAIVVYCGVLDDLRNLPKILTIPYKGILRDEKKIKIRIKCSDPLKKVLGQLDKLKTFKNI